MKVQRRDCVNSPLHKGNIYKMQFEESYILNFNSHSINALSVIVKQISYEVLSKKLITLFASSSPLLRGSVHCWIVGQHSELNNYQVSSNCAQYSVIYYSISCETSSGLFIMPDSFHILITSLFYGDTSNGRFPLMLILQCNFTFYALLLESY